MKTIGGSAERVIDRLERVSSAVAAVFLFAIMLIIVADVTLRYVFNSPLQWAFDAISMYLMVGVFFFSLSDTLAGNGHVNVDLLYQRAPRRVQRFADFIGCALTCAVFVGIVYRAAVATWESWTSGEVIAGNIAWPVWITHFVVAIGSGLLALRLLLMLLPVSRSLPAHDMPNAGQAEEGPGGAVF